MKIRHSTNYVESTWSNKIYNAIQITKSNLLKGIKMMHIEEIFFFFNEKDAINTV